MIIDAQTLKVLQNIEAFGHANDAQETDRARRMLNLERNTAELISPTQGFNLVSTLGTVQPKRVALKAGNLRRANPHGKPWELPQVRRGEYRRAQVPHIRPVPHIRLVPNSHLFRGPRAAFELSLIGVIPHSDLSPDFHPKDFRPRRAKKA